MKPQGGFTLLELIVVIIIITILLAAAVLNFNRLNQKYRVESDVKNIYTILLKARNDAASSNIQQIVLLAANQIQTGPDANADNNIDGVPNTTPINQFTVVFNNAQNPVVYDRRGLTSNTQTIQITGYSNGISPKVDCIAVEATRINMGLMTGGVCVQQ